MSTEELEYSAGFFDGEGCLQIVRHKNRFWSQIRITNTHRGILDWFQRRFGGCVCRQPPNKAVGKCLPTWFWQVEAKKARAFTAQVADLLRIKGAQAIVLAQFDARVMARGRDLSRLSGHEIIERQGLKEKLSAMKREPRAVDAAGPVSNEYVAGLFDAEGSVGISDIRGSLHLYVSLTNTDRPILDLMNAKYGGWVMPKSDNSTRKMPCYAWGSCGEDAEAFLMEVLPCLIVKREQAKLAIAFHGAKIGGALTKDLFDYKGKISAFNKGAASP